MLKYPTHVKLYIEAFFANPIYLDVSRNRIYLLYRIQTQIFFVSCTSLLISRDFFLTPWGIIFSYRV